MNKGVEIRLELGIDAQRFIQQVRIQSYNIEEQITKGIELALNDICQGDNLIQSVREATKSELLNIVNKAVLSYEVRSKIEKLVFEKISNKVQQYADSIADNVTSSLHKIPLG